MSSLASETVMSVQHWKQVSAAGRSVVATTQASEVREDDLDTKRVEVHNAITNDLGATDRQLAGDHRLVSGRAQAG